MLNVQDILDLSNIKKGLALAKPKDLIKLKTFRNVNGEKMSIIVHYSLLVVH
ncbi:MAG: hypothetical protein E6916_05010 [Clostridium cochlearium]|uniref:hypothetical protein n=1 Tax=Clostridium cochlearium TaxID=1494 RepID=UPI00280C08CB|nr:hypothetical protein [Clostridium cochlearium]MDU1442860.1 hypothetical protein [Clostridium cochlearium]